MSVYFFPPEIELLLDLLRKTIDETEDRGDPQLGRYETIRLKLLQERAERRRQTSFESNLRELAVQAVADNPGKPIAAIKQLRLMAREQDEYVGVKEAKDLVYEVRDGK